MCKYLINNYSSSLYCFIYCSNLCELGISTYSINETIHNWKILCTARYYLSSSISRAQFSGNSFGFNDYSLCKKSIRGLSNQNSRFTAANIEITAGRIGTRLLLYGLCSYIDLTTFLRLASIPRYKRVHNFNTFDVSKRYVKRLISKYIVCTSM